MSIPPSTRRRRRRRRTIVVLAVATVVAVLALAVRLRSEQRDVAAYLATAREVTTVSAEVAVGLNEILAALGQVARNDVLDLLQRLETSFGASRAVLESATVPPPVAEVHGFLLVATTSWGDAIASFDEAIRMTVDDPEDRAGEEVLRAVFELLRVGDRAYTGFLAAVGELGETTQEFGEVRYVMAGSEALYDAGLVAGRLRNLQVLSERRDLGLTGRIDPEPLAQRSSIRVLPYTEAVLVQVVVTNAGNLAESQIPVTLRLVPVPRGDAVVQEALIAELQPGGSTTLTFDSLAIEPGRVYEVRVGLELAADENPDNDEWGLVFVGNDPA